MKKGILLLLVLNIFVVFVKANNTQLITDLKSVFANKSIDVKDKQQDILFDYQVYKKLIQDNFLDDLIIKSGFEPNQETRAIFFSALTKELQDTIKKSFTEYTGSNVNNFDPNVFMQAEMTRNLSSVLNNLNSKLDKENSIKTKHLILGGIFLYLFAKLGFIRSAFKASFNLLKAAENVDGKSSKVFGFINSTIKKTSALGRSFLTNIYPVDFSKDVKESEEFFTFYEFFEKYLKNDKDFVRDFAKNYESIEVVYTDKDGVTRFKRLEKDADLSFV
jgi:hypothetical protein